MGEMLRDQTGMTTVIETQEAYVKTLCKRYLINNVRVKPNRLHGSPVAPQALVLLAPSP
jgi:hypothetical protein